MLPHSSAVALVCALAAPAVAGDAQFQLPEREVYEGVPFQLLIRITDATAFTPPSAPEIPGAKVRVLEGGRQSMTSIVNGKVKSSTSVTFVVEITPDHAGPLTIPSVAVTVDGRESRSRAQEVQVKKSEAGELLSAEIFGQPPEVYIGQPLTLVLRIAIRPFRDPAFRPLNEADMWQLVDLQGSQWGAFEPEIIEHRQRGTTPRAQQEVRDGKTFFVYELTRTLWPPKSGVPDVGGIRVRMTYPLKLREVQNLFFDRQLTITESRPLAVTAEATGIEVLPLPEAGRPASFTGAVGTFQLDVSARPTTVAVGDPITLTIALVDQTKGGSNMDTLQPPALAATAALTKDFRVPSDALSGTVNGSVKRFTVTVRPQRAGIPEVPPIEFSYFDPAQKRYVTVKSRPIPLTVTPAAQMDLSKIVTGEGAAPPGGARTPATQLTEVEGGLVANRPVTSALLANHRIELDAMALLALGMPPAAAAGALAWRLHRRRHESDAGLARRSRARQNAERRVLAANDAAGVAGAVTGFVEDSLGRPAGTLTRGDLSAVLAASRVPEGVRTCIAELLVRCDRARYAPGAEGASVADLQREARAAIDALEAAGLRRAKGGGE